MLRRWLWLGVALPLTVWGHMVAPDAGVTPFMLVCRSGTAAQIEAALPGADLNSRTRYQNRGALEFALENPQPFEAVSLLLAHGADPEQSPHFPADAIALLAKHQADPERSAALERVIALWLDLPIRHDVDDALLRLAAFHRDIALFDRLKKAGAEVAIRLPSPLLAALAADNSVAVAWLLANGADPDGRDADDRPAVVFACGSECLNLLLDHGADPGTPFEIREGNAMWITPELAARLGKLRVFRTGMIALGANPELPRLYHLLSAAYGAPPPVTEMAETAIRYGQVDNVEFLKHQDPASDWRKFNLYSAVFQSPCLRSRAQQKEMLKYLLAQDVPVDAVDPVTGRTPLLQLCGARNPASEFVAILLQHGADAAMVDAKGRDAVDCLLSPSEGDDKVEVLKLLWAHGAPREPKDSRYNRLLMALANEQPPELIHFLIESGAEVNFRGAAGVTPLMLAALLYRADVAAELIARGAEINARDDTGWTPLFYACHRFDTGQPPDQIVFLPRNCSPGAANATVQLLLAHGAIADLRDAFGAAPVTEAAAWCDAETIDRLIRAGGPGTVAARDNHSRNAILYAVRYNDDPAVAEALLVAGADPDSTMRAGKYPERTMSFAANSCFWFEPDQFGVDATETMILPGGGGWIDPPLFAAIRRDDPALVRLLLRYGADVNLRRPECDRQGRTVAELEMLSGAVEAALLDAGVKLRASDHDFLLSPSGRKFAELCRSGTIAEVEANYVPAAPVWELLPLAARENSLAVVQFLIAKNGDRFSDSRVFDAAANGAHPEVVAYLLARDRDLLKYARGPEDIPILGRAATGAIMDILIAYGADVNAKNKKGETPLLWFLVHGDNAQLRLAECLLARGADAKIRDAAGAEPLTLLVLNHGLAASTDVGRRLMRELVRRGNDINATWEGRLLLDEALTRNRPELFEALVACGADPGRSTCDRSKLSPYLRRRMAELVGE